MQVSHLYSVKHELYVNVQSNVNSNVIECARKHEICMYCHDDLVEVYRTLINYEKGYKKFPWK